MPNWLDGAGSGSHRATTQVKGSSTEISIVSEADTVHKGAGSILITGNGEGIRTRRCLRPWRGDKGNSCELGRVDVFPKRML